MSILYLLFGITSIIIVCFLIYTYFNDIFGWIFNPNGSSCIIGSIIGIAIVIYLIANNI